MSTAAIAVIATLAALFAGAQAHGDIFYKPSTDEILTGYVGGETPDGKLILQTIEKGRIEAAPGEYAIRRNAEGRNNKVVVFAINDSIMLEAHTAALEEEMAKAAAEGPLFILLEIDTPGGRVDLARRICAAIEALHCDVVAYVKSARHGGAISAGATVALACDRIYMARAATMGAATLVGAAEGGGIESIHERLGEEVGEKISSAWQGYMAGIAESKGRPALLARAMVDRNVEVVEVHRGGTRVFIDPVNVGRDEEVVRTWSRRGSLLTMTAGETLQSGIAEGIVESREQLLQKENAPEAAVIENRKPDEAAETVRLARMRRDALINSIDRKIEEIQRTRVRRDGLRLLRQIRDEMSQLLMMARRFPDLEIDVDSLQETVIDVERTFREAMR